MGGSGSMLGDLKHRVRTDVRLSGALLGHIEDVCRYLGVPKNAYFSLAAGFFTIKLSPLLPGKKRQQLLTDLENILQALLAEARKSV